MKYLVIGGTGSLGSTLIRKLSRNPENEITCFSRCELKQKQLEAALNRPANVRFVLGDVRDYASVNRVACGFDTIFHVAALKHIDVLEANPEESVKTNVLGTMNVIDAAKNNGVKHVLFSSTDKAVMPINVYGHCKAISEQMILNHGFTVFRWGNVIGSRGSALHYFAKTLKEEGRAYITSPKMSRFWITLDAATDFVLSNFAAGNCVKIPPMKASSLKRVVEATAKIQGVENFEYVVTGLRPGEKIHEAITQEISSDICAQYTDAELLALVKEGLGV